MTLVTYATDFQLHSYEICKRFRVANLSIHFWSNITNLLVLTVVSIERRRITKMINVVSSSSKKRKCSLLGSISFALVIVIPVFFLFHVRYEADYSRNGCALAFHKKMAKCKGLFAQCSGFPIVITVTATITGCSIVLYAMTKKLKEKVVNSDEKISTALAKARITNTKRIQAINFLWITFTILWVPYGITRLTIHAEISMNTFFSISGIFHTVFTLNHLSIPIIYYKMDVKFRDFVKKILKYCSNFFQNNDSSADVV